jgi:predicted metal-binding membrane protein
MDATGKAPLITKPATAAGGGDVNGRAAAMALLAVLGLAAGGWVITIARMHGMDMGAAARLGALPYFLSLWVPMMAAMMLPGTVPAAQRLVGARGRMLYIPRYVGAYLAIWALFGVIVYVLYRPHGTITAGAFTVAAGAYELTSTKRRFRQMCQDRVSSGLELGLCCVGSTVGLMLMMVALGVMSLTWMAVTAVVVLVQKLLPPRTAIDALVAMAIVALGIAVIVVPASVPGLVQPM